jgi:hypothetical protein
MKKRSLLLGSMAVVLIALLILSGCGQTTDSNPNPSAGGTTIQPVSPGLSLEDITELFSQSDRVELTGKDAEVPVVFSQDLAVPASKTLVAGADLFLHITKTAPAAASIMALAAGDVSPLTITVRGALEIARDGVIYIGENANGRLRTGGTATVKDGGKLFLLLPSGDDGGDLFAGLTQDAGSKLVLEAGAIYGLASGVGNITGAEDGGLAILVGGPETPFKEDQGPGISLTKGTITQTATAITFADGSATVNIGILGEEGAAGSIPFHIVVDNSVLELGQEVTLVVPAPPIPNQPSLKIANGGRLVGTPISEDEATDNSKITFAAGATIDGLAIYKPAATGSTTLTLDTTTVKFTADTSYEWGVVTPASGADTLATYGWVPYDDSDGD